MSSTFRFGLVSLLLLLVGFLTVYPTAMLLYGSLHSTPPGEPGVFNLAGYRGLMTAETARVLADTIWISLVKTMLSLPIALGLAWIIARTDTPYASILEVFITLPFFLPPILTAMAWAMLGNPNAGSLNLIWQALTGSERGPFNVYSYSGVIWHMMQYSIPFLFLLTVDSFRAMDPALEESSRMSGASRWTTFRRVTFKLLAPITSAVFLLSFIRGVEAFDSAVFFGTPARIEVFTTKLYHSINHQAHPDYQYATALSIAVMALMFLPILWRRYLLRQRSFQTVSGKGFRPQTIALGRMRWVTLAICVLFVLINLILPVGQLILGSFFRFFGFYTADMLTLDNYTAVMTNNNFWRAMWNTLLLGVLAASLTMLVGGIVAYIVIRTRLRSRGLLDTLSWLPWMMPGMVIGIGFLWGFALLPGLPIYGTLWALLIAYITLGLPLAVRTMSGSFIQLSYDLEECSRVHGASWWQTFWRILIAIGWPSFAITWVLTFFMVLRELSASILLYSVGNEVLSVVMLQMWTNGKVEEVSVVGLMLLLLVFLFRFLQTRVLRRSTLIRGTSG